MHTQRGATQPQRTRLLGYDASTDHQHVPHALPPQLLQQFWHQRAVPRRLARNPHNVNVCASGSGEGKHQLQQLRQTVCCRGRAESSAQTVEQAGNECRAQPTARASGARRKENSSAVQHGKPRVRASRAPPLRACIHSVPRHLLRSHKQRPYVHIKPQIRQPARVGTENRSRRAGKGACTARGDSRGRWRVGGALQPRLPWRPEMHTQASTRCDTSHGCTVAEGGPGPPCGHHFGAPVVPILPHLGDQDARTAARLGLKPRHRSPHRLELRLKRDRSSRDAGGLSSQGKQREARRKAANEAARPPGQGREGAYGSTPRRGRNSAQAGSKALGRGRRSLARRSRARCCRCRLPCRLRTEGAQRRATSGQQRIAASGVHARRVQQEVVVIQCRKVFGWGQVGAHAFLRR